MFNMVGHFFIPMVIFVVVYWKIFSVIRRHARVGNTGRQELNYIPNTYTVSQKTRHPTHEFYQRRKNILKVIFLTQMFLNAVNFLYEVITITIGTVAYDVGQ